MNILSQTSRLYLREITPDDAEFAYRLNLDPEVIRYTGDEAFANVNAAREFLENYSHYKDYGFGRWGMALKETGELIGWCGLKFTKDLNEYDLGYRLLKDHWGKGYASEASFASLKLGFERFNMEEIVGRVVKDNIASVRVLEKIGMRFKSLHDFHGQEGLKYRITKEEFLLQ